MNRPELRYLFGFFFLAWFWAGPMFAQTEPESASNAIVQSNSNGRTKEIKIGEGIKYRLLGEKKYSKHAEFKGIVGETAIIGDDTIPLSQLQTIATRNEKKHRTGKHFLIFHFIVRVLLILFAVFLGIFLVNAGWVVFYLIAIVGIAAFIISAPFFYIGLILLIIANRTFDVRRLWQLKAKPSHSPNTTDPK